MDYSGGCYRGKWFLKIEGDLALICLCLVARYPGNLQAVSTGKKKGAIGPFLINRDFLLSVVDVHRYFKTESCIAV